ncbi:MAG: gamma carbonic anhydrase family protein [bacterium]|nr:gamma carbonic anhydrase family protein [bacterium]
MKYNLGNKIITITEEDHFIANNATLIGSIIIEKDASIWFNVVIRADMDTIVIGEGSNIQDGSVLHTDKGKKLTIGKRVTVGHKAMLHGCTIGDDSLIGINSVILNGAVIGKNCLIGANALVTEGKVIPDRSLVVGSPAQILREVTEADIKSIEDAAAHYIKNFKDYKKNLREM